MSVRSIGASTAAVNPDFKLISRSVTSAAAARIDITTAPFPATYRNYKVILSNLRNDSASSWAYGEFRINGSYTANMASQTVATYGSVTSGNYNTITSAYNATPPNGWYVSGNFAGIPNKNTGGNTTVEIDLYQPNSTSEKKHILAKFGILANSTPYVGVGYADYYLNSSSAISDFAIYTSVNFASGVVVEIYGIGAV